MTSGGAGGGADGGADRGPLPEVHVHVPDDARDLARDLEALRRERRAQARRDRLRRLVLTSRDGRTRLSGLGLTGALLVVLVPAVLLALLTPQLASGPPPSPLAAPPVAPGQVGGLLPDVVLLVRTGTLPVRATTRPGVLLLVPAACRCDAAVSDVTDQALDQALGVRLVVDGSAGEAAATREADRLRLGPARGLVPSAVDGAGALSRAYSARGLTLLAVAADGVVTHVVRDVQPGQRLTRLTG